MEDEEAARLPPIAAIMTERTHSHSVLFLSYTHLLSLLTYVGFRLIDTQSQIILDRILAGVQRIPYGLRFLCKKIHQYGQVH